MRRKETETRLLYELSKRWGSFTDKLPIGFDVESALSSLILFRDQNEDYFKNYASEIFLKTKFSQINKKEDGMNSPGILWDRLTILNCKFFFTSSSSPHYNINIHKSNTNINSELCSVLKALHVSKPARHILLAKESTERQKDASDLGYLLWQLQYSNLAMWINQDLLYTVDVSDVQEVRLRNYIKFFSDANRIRNTSIEKIEIFYTKILSSTSI